MSEPIKVIFTAVAEELAAVDINFGRRVGIEVVLKTDSYSIALKTACELEHPVVVMRVREPELADEFTAALRKNNIKYVCICRCANAGFLMLQNGAAEMLTRDDKGFTADFNGLTTVLRVKIKSAYDKYFGESSRRLKGEYGKFDRIIAIGSSTGGTETVLEVLKNLPADMPPILVVQHMPPVFTKLYAERLHKICKMSAWEARDGDILRRGLILLAPGDFQMRLVLKNGVYSVSCEKGERKTGHCPSVDVLFYSVAQAAGSKAIGVILTGMGRDGAEGLLLMRRKGAITFGQDEESCVVYGMPKEAFDIGAVGSQLSVKELPAAIMKAIEK